MNETIKHTGIFHVYDHPGYDTEVLRDWLNQGLSPLLLPGVDNYQRRPNIIMAAQKLLMANAVYPTITSLAITSQTSTPTDSETEYTGLIYQAGVSQEFTRSGNTNPYTVGWNILSDDANGTWGSFILLNETGAMINRALAGVSKSSGTAKLVIFTGSVIS